WQDGDGLGGYIFSWNNSGTWVNDTFADMTSTSNWSNVTKTLNSTAGIDIGWRFYANDTLDRWNDTGIRVITITDDTAPSVTNIKPANGATINGTQFINATVSDVLSSISSVTANVSNLTWSNTYILTDSGIGNVWYNDSWNTTLLADGAYNLTINATDSFGKSNSTESVSITLDNYENVAPSIFSLQPLAGTYNGTIDINASVTDATSVDTKYWWWQNGTDAGTNQTLNGTLDTTAIANGSYTVKYWANDTLGNINATESVSITVENYDNAAPSISAPSDISVSKGATKKITWTITETGPGQYYVLRNSIEVASPASYTSGTEINQIIDTSTTGTWNYSIIANDTSGNKAQDDVTVTITSGGGGGGGGGGSKSSYESLIQGVLAGQTVDLDIEDEDIPYINALSITVKRDVYYSKLSITGYDKKPSSGLKDLDARAYRYFKVSYDKNSYIESAKFMFSVNTSWLRDNDIDPFKFAIYRYTDNWEELESKILDEYGGKIYYEATTPGFSYFSLGGIPKSGFKPFKEEKGETPKITPSPTSSPAPALETPPPNVTLSLTSTPPPVEEKTLPVENILPVFLTVALAGSVVYVYQHQRNIGGNLLFGRSNEDEKRIIEAQRRYIRRVTTVLKDVITEPEEIPMGEKVPAIRELWEEGISLSEDPPSNAPAEQDSTEEKGPLVTSDLRGAIQKISRDSTKDGLGSVEDIREKIRKLAKDAKKNN
ncbi:MAG: PGF-pre-PGF domain-containing protein, partial [Candidatus Hydrothermarchaeaceae archaeon]